MYHTQVENLSCEIRFEQMALSNVYARHEYRRRAFYSIRVVCIHPHAVPLL